MCNGNGAVSYSEHRILVEFFVSLIVARHLRPPRSVEFKNILALRVCMLMKFYYLRQSFNKFLYCYCEIMIKRKCNLELTLTRK